MRRIIVAGLLGGAAVYLWSALSWSVLPFQTGKFRDIPDEQQVAELLSARLPAAGVYHYPAYPTANASEAEVAAWTQRVERGPVIPLLVFQPGGSNSAVTAYVRAFVLDVMAALIVAMLLLLAVHTLPGYGQRVLFVTGIGIFAVLVSHLADWNWGLFPASYSVVMAADIIIGWTLAGVVMAWRIRPEGVR
ncbi:MAG TPA: hypothetical protein VJ596_02385 [Gemmatimonadaceae bacterium]|nr:hypothetical protein [Gemmatimonadaceae bacterium]